MTKSKPVWTAFVFSFVAFLTLSGVGEPARATTLPAQPSSPQLTLPAPTGRQLIGTTTLHLVDASRPDPWVPTDPVRELMIQLWYPASTVAGYPRASWLTTKEARAYEQQLDLPVLNWPVTDGHLGAPVGPHRGGWPVVVYSPGLGDPRGENTAVVEDLASHGYVVATIDHVHDSSAVELPDGRLETAAMPDLTPDNESAVFTKEVDSRVADTRFVLDQLTAIEHGDNPDHEHRPLPSGLSGALDLDRIGMFGFSNGGSTTAHALHVDPRIKAGFDMDGTPWTPEAAAGSDRPLLLFGEEHLTPTEAAGWSELRTRQRGPLLQLSLTGSMHGTLTDLAVLAPQFAPLVGWSLRKLGDAVGTVNGQRAITEVRGYLRAWFDTYLRDHPSRLLTGPSPRFPEVTFVP